MADSEARSIAGRVHRICLEHFRRNVVSICDEPPLVLDPYLRGRADATTEIARDLMQKVVDPALPRTEPHRLRLVANNGAMQRRGG